MWIAQTAKLCFPYNPPTRDGSARARLCKTGLEALVRSEDHDSKNIFVRHGRMTTRTHKASIETWFLHCVWKAFGGPRAQVGDPCAWREATGRRGIVVPNWTLAC